MRGSLRIGVIGGAGWLGGAIAGALLDAGLARPSDLSLSYRRGVPNLFPEAHWTKDNQELADRSDVIMVSVRPEHWPALDVDARGKLVISVMAGIRISAICDAHRTERAVRALPNAGAEVAMSYTPWAASSAVSAEDRSIVRSIFEACGVEDEVSSERDIDYLTGLSGSGPAFPALLASAMIEHATVNGLPADLAHRAVATVLKGTGRLFEKREQCPGEIVRTFVDYRGTTAAAILEMRAAGFDEAIAKGLAAAFNKSVSMGNAS
jgi:pyrroline-5-carboxylate reductase